MSRFDRAAELLDQPADPSTLSALYDRSGGNPLFLVELAALHHVDGELPGTLRALISARLDQLTPSQRRVIENASVLGTNGAGKTSLMRVLIGLAQPSAGEVWRRPGMRIGYLEQEPALVNDPRFKLYPEWIQKQVQGMTSGAPAFFGGGGASVMKVPTPRILVSAPSRSSSA